ncbi:bile acid:sodium symporter family protein [Streptomyces sp. NBC_00243]|uniref:bile acid:sodium symporter family protein n=1 Tax=Streptomyces sp. NBC_00243 TaxID=2975688 RepID=UPI002DDBA505|nr:bile acid:sodium symporter family protein [Streptomyces sp. NBC_00243]WRZ25396.1 bile acid:sodium symporter family protein [Streptomyces sp. NBC_00243]
MSEVYITVLLPVAIVITMFGLGLTLTMADLARVFKAPKAAVVCLFCQVLVLPAIAFGLAVSFDLAPELAVGMMLLAASPGGPSASLFSHLAGGDVALNIAVTAINSVIAMVTFPAIAQVSMAHFLGEGRSIGLPADKLIQVVVTVVIPVVVGMWVHHRYTAWAERMRGPVKVGSVIVLVAVIIGAVSQQYDVLLDNAGTLTVITLLFCVCSLTIGYFVPRLFQVGLEQAIASAMEIGIHNAVLAITVAITVLDNPTMAIPPAVYGILMYFPVALVAYGFAHRAGVAKLEGVSD